MRFPLTEPPQQTLAALVGALDMVDIAIVLLNPALQIRYFNRRFAETFAIFDAGSSPAIADVLNIAAGEGIFAVPRRDLSDTVATWAATIAEGSGQPFLIELADGRWLQCRSRLCPDGGRLISCTDARRDTGLQDVEVARRINAELRFNTETLEDYAAHLAALAEATDDARARLEQEIAERRVLEAKLRELATTDALTGALNRAEILNVGQRELEAAQRFQQRLSVLMLDLDHFKSINDRFGHAGGDQALRHVVALLAGAIRSSDALGRLGGEEFVLILPATPCEAAGQVAERLRLLIAETPAVSGDGTIPMTVSIGLAMASPADRSIEDAIGRADRALYEAKNGGRNRVAVACSLAIACDPV
jgi:diguanylate cyclase (GGDEF)-like protein